MGCFFPVATVGILAALFFRIFVIDLDVTRVIYNHHPGKCEIIPGLDKGSEDVQFLSNGHALISSGLYFPIGYRSPKPGRLFIFDPVSAVSAQPLAVSGGADWRPETFYPSGISVWESSGKTNVYVVNSLLGRIEMFSLHVQQKTMTHRGFLSSDLLTSPNNIAVVDRDRFYVTNFLWSQNPVLCGLEIALKLPLGSVLFYDGNKFVPVLSYLGGPNGVAVSKDNKFLYVALHAKKQILVYSIQSFTSLTLVRKIDIFTSPDNLYVDNHGALWIGAQPVAYKMGIHTQYPDYPAPSHVLKMQFNKHHATWKLEEIYADDGSQLSGATVAAVSDRNFIIGTMRHRALICALP